MAPSHVLVPLDGSPLADAALQHALETFECRTTVLNVVTPLDASMSEGGLLGDVVDEDREAAAEERANDLVSRATETAAAVGRSVETTVESGEPAETIVAYVSDHDVDHVVMGGHGGRTGLASRLLGTVATTVVAEAPTTVTVVRE
ncbi:universal stress protein [Halorubellus sp. JP-L1]|uniref:universal stress protein n=1 Tax=Halorubellus sp. JP-L1 TaxID=2715753 RepID=UPI00140BE967|nr:universal stress protein [Halorubellus sp. JP-L1]NHN43277.1 universal stress protein [Halorubellus sp. JP-L1]